MWVQEKALEAKLYFGTASRQQRTMAPAAGQTKSV